MAVAKVTSIFNVIHHRQLTAKTYSKTSEVDEKVKKKGTELCNEDAEEKN